jgi:hypothetical protein
VVHTNEEGYSSSDGVTRYKNKFCIGQNTAMQTKLITSFHGSALGRGAFRNIGNISQDVQTFIKQCTICQRGKHKLCKYPGLLHPLPIPQSSQTNISMDFIEGLPSSNGISVIMVVVDRFTKYSHLFPIKHPYTTSSIAQVSLDNVVKLHGVPQTIVYDHDRVFTGSFWTELFKLLRIDLKLISAYHPQIDSQIEHVNQCLEMFLR